MLRSRVFLGGQAVSMLGDGLAILAVPLLVLQLTRSPVAAVLAALPGSVGYLAADLPGGVPAHRLPVGPGVAHPDAGLRRRGRDRLLPRRARHRRAGRVRRLRA